MHIFVYLGYKQLYVINILLQRAIDSCISFGLSVLFAMFLVFCEEDRSYLIVEESKAIFEDGVKKDDKIQFYHCNKMYMGCVIGRSDDENVLIKWRKQAIEKDKQTAKASKPIHGYSPKKTKRQRVCNVKYSPPSHTKKKSTSNKKQKIYNKNNKNNDTLYNNVKTQQLTATFSSSSEELSSDEDRSNNNCDNENISHSNLVHDKTQSTARDNSLATLLRRINEMKATNARLQTLLEEKRALSSPSSSSGIDSVCDANKENIYVEFKNKELPSTSSQTYKSREIYYSQSKAVSEEAMSELNENIVQGENEVQEENIVQEENMVQGENIVQEENIKDLVPDALRQVQQLYGKDFNENGETMVLLGNNIYCKSSVLHYALGSSIKTTHLVRKLVLGIFKEDIFKKGPNQVTLTGNVPRSVGKQLNTKYKNIDVVARSTIIKYAKAIGKRKKWSYVHTKDLERTLSQKIGELKRETNKYI